MPTHFDYPFIFSAQNKHANEVEQDSIDDIANCVTVALATEVGSRPEIPTFGTPDQVFSLLPLSLGQLLQAVETSEPRASVLLSQSISQADPLVVQLTAAVTLRKAT